MHNRSGVKYYLKVKLLVLVWVIVVTPLTQTMAICIFLRQ